MGGFWGIRTRSACSCVIFMVGSKEGASSSCDGSAREEPTKRNAKGDPPDREERRIPRQIKWAALGEGRWLRRQSPPPVSPTQRMTQERPESRYSWRTFTASS